MRGLDAQQGLENARAIEHTEPERYARALIDATLKAADLGAREYWSGAAEPPERFKNEPMLLQAWFDGRETAAVMDGLINCPTCNTQIQASCKQHG